jgi:hypothetical protein
MAAVKYGLGITEIRGAVGGAVFQRCGKVLSIRENRHHNPAKSTFGNSSRTQFSYIANAWRILTAAQKSAWNAVASGYPATDPFGNTITLTGYQVFVRLNRWVILSNSPIVSTAQAYNPPASNSMTTYGFNHVGSQFFLTFQGSLTAGHIWLFFVSNPYPYPSNYVKYKTYYICGEPSSVTDNQNIWSDVIAPMRQPLTANTGFRWQILHIVPSTGQYVREGSGFAKYV